MKIKYNIPIFNKLKEDFKKIKEKIQTKNSNIKDKKEKRTELRYYTLLVLMVGIGIFSLILNIETSTEIGNEKYTTYNIDENSDEELSDNEEVKETNASADVDDTQVTKYEEAISSTYTDIPNIEEETEEENEAETNESYVYEYSYIMPVDGEIIREFSIDEVVYLKTIDMWKIHEGVDISASIGDTVVAIEKGTVVDINTSEFYGVTIEIDHGNGYTSRYSNLDEKVKVEIGDDVKKGQEIAIIGNTASGESADESHLHFEIMKNGEYIDPEILGIK